MGEDLGLFIDNLVKQGASDEEIDLLVKDFQSRQLASQKPVPTQERVREKALQKLPYSLGTIPVVGDAILAAKRGISQGETADLITAAGEDPNPNAIKDIAKAQKNIQANPPSDSYSKFSQAKSFSEGLDAFSDDPLRIMSELTTESLAALITHGFTRVGAGAATGAGVGSIIPGIGTGAGAATGAVGGIGMSSLNLEYSGSILESLSELGYNPSDPESLKKAFSDEDSLDQLKTHALAKGVPIAIFDMLSAGVAGSLVKQAGKNVVKQTLAGVGELGIQAGLGGGGEAAGEIISGEEIQPGAILAEMVGELGPGSAEIVTGVALKGNNEIDTKVNETIDNVTNNPDPVVDTDIDNSVIEAQNAIKQLFDTKPKKANTEETTTPVTVDESELETITPSNKEDITKFSKDIFELDDDQSAAVAEIADRMVGVMAERNNITPEEQYQKLKFIKGDEKLAKQLQAVPGIKNQLDVFHGSAYQFDKFSTEKIGSGNHLTAFGWGLYFTDKEGIAKSYGNKPFVIDILPKFFGEYKDKKGNDVAKLLADKYNGDFEEYFKDLDKGFIPKTSEISALERLQERINQDKQFGRILYKTKLHQGKAPKDYTYMNWKKPVDKVIKDRVISAFTNKINQDDNAPNQAATVLSNYIDRWTGEDLYGYLQEELGGQREASMFLLENGIDGITAPAVATRNKDGDVIYQEDGPKTYVVFDDQAVSIEEMVKFQKNRKEAKGAMRMTTDGQAIIYALSNPDVTTPLHELAHVFEGVLTDSEKKSILDWTNQKEWTTETSEAFARGFEKYIASGEAPNSKIQALFDKFKEWIKAVYKGARNSPLKIELNDAMKKVYSDMIGEKQTPVKKEAPKKTEKKAPTKTKKDTPTKTAPKKRKPRTRKKAVKKETVKDEGFTKEEIAAQKKLEREKIKQQKLQEKLQKEAEQKAEKEAADKLTREVKAYDSFHAIMKDRPSKQKARLEKLANSVEEFPKLVAKIDKALVKLQEKEEGNVTPLDKEPTVEDLKKSLQNIPDEDITIDLDDDFAGDILFQNGNTNRPRPKKGVIPALLDRMELNEDIKTKADIKEYLNKINEGLPEENKLGEEYISPLLKGLEKRRETFQSIIDFQKAALAELSKHSKPFNTIGGTRELIKQYLDVNYATLPKEGRRAYRSGLIDIIENRTPSKKAFSVQQKYHADRKLANLRNLKFNFADMTNKTARIAVQKGANPATLTSIAAKYNKKAASTLLHEVYGNLMNLATQADLHHKNFSDEMDAIALKYKTNRKDHIRAQMFGTSFATKIDPKIKEGYWEEVLHNLDLIIDNSESKIYAIKHKLDTRQSMDEAKIELNIAKELKKSISKERALPEDSKILTKGQKALYDKFRSFASQLEPLMIMNTQGVWGSDITPLHNYMPKAAIGKTTGISSEGDLRTDPLIESNASNLMEATTQTDYGDILAQRSGFTKPRRNPKGYYYDYNILSVARRWSKSTLFDAYVSNEVKTLNRLLVPKTKSDINQILGPQLLRVLQQQVGDIIGSGKRFNSIDDIVRGKIFVDAMDKLATAIIATTGQFFTQASSAIPAALIMSPKGFPKALAALSGMHKGTTDWVNLRDWMTKHGMGIQVRDILFERFQTVEDFNREGFLRGPLLFAGKAEKWTTGVLRWTDKQAARLVWLSEFFAQGGTFEKPTEKAVLAAERAVGLMQNMSNSTFAASGFKPNSAAGKVMMKMFYAFKSFAVNAGLNAYASAYYAFGKNSDEAKQVLGASVAMSVAYNAAALYVIAPLYSGAASAAGGVLSSVFGTDVPDASDDDDDKRTTQLEELATRTIWDLLFGQLLPEFADNMLRYLYVEHGGKYTAKTLHGIDFDSYNRYTDTPLYAPKSIPEAIGTGTGLPGDILTQVAEVTETLIKSAEAESNDDIDKTDIIKLASSTISMLTLIPFRGDIRKILNAYVQQLKADKRQSKGASPSVPSKPPTRQRVVPRSPVRPRRRVRPRIKPNTR